MKTRIAFHQMKGKTIQDARVNCVSDIILTFTDGTFLYLTTDVSVSTPTYSMEISDEEEISRNWETLKRLGVLSKEEVAALKKSRRGRRARKR